MKNLIILALGAWGATQLYKSAQRRRGADPLGAGGAAGVGGFPSADVSGAGFDTSAGTADLSPNTAERLQETQAGGAFAGAGGGTATPSVFPEAERQEGDEPRPGLPDFARGA